MSQQKEEQKKLLIEVMEADAKDGLYEQQTAVEWLTNELELYHNGESKLLYVEIIEQAEQKEKEQIRDAFNKGVRRGAQLLGPDSSLYDGTNYYNEIYGK